MARWDLGVTCYAISALLRAKLDETPSRRKLALLFETRPEATGR